MKRVILFISMIFFSFNGFSKTEVLINTNIGLKALVAKGEITCKSVGAARTPNDAIISDFGFQGLVKFMEFKYKATQIGQILDQSLITHVGEATDGNYIFEMPRTNEGSLFKSKVISENENMFSVGLNLFLYDEDSQVFRTITKRSTSCSIDGVCPGLSPNVLYICK